MEPLGPVRSTSLWNGPVEQAVGNLEILEETYKYFSFLSKIGHSQRSSTRGKMWNLWYSVEKKLPNNNVDENVSGLEDVLRSI